MTTRIALCALLALLLVGLVGIAPSMADDDEPAAPVQPADPPAQPADPPAKPEPPAPVVGKEVGNVAPDFSLKDQNSNDVKLGDLRGKIVVLEWFKAACPFVVRHYNAGTMTNLAKAYAEKNVVWLAINSTRGATIESNKQDAEKLGVGTLLDDSAGTVGQAYDAKRTPEMVVIDADGKIRYRGAIDDDRFGRNPNPTNYVKAALDALLVGKDIAVVSTTPYG